jgi:hypothetical protein
MMEELKSVVNQPRDAVVRALCNAVPEYQPAGTSRKPVNVPFTSMKLSTPRAA